ncbi:MAG TPA: hypothetical protein VKR32_10630 [Puia sp.]|nr:hypothetical protein [Puia sp.]
METHAQDLHKAPGHGLKHYFFEFFMLFLAVFFGFLAENLRENIINQEKEKHYVESLLADLKKDTTDLAESYRAQFFLISKMTKVLGLPVEALRQPAIQDSLYQSLAPVYSEFWIFIPTNNTMTQLKNAGGFGVFNDEKIIDSINDLDFYYESYVKMNSEYYSKSYEKTVDIAEQVIKLPDATLPFYDTIVPAVASSGKVLIQYSTILLEELYTSIRFQRGQLSACVGFEKQYEEKARNLISLLQREYHIK